MNTKKLFLYTSYAWTASAAGWAVIGWVTGIGLAYAAAVGCAALSGLWVVLSDAVGDPDGSE